MSNDTLSINQAGKHASKVLIIEYFWCLVAALLINLFCNSFSPFFSPEGAMDPNCFYAEGCAIAHGCLPYRDFIDVKGPLLFLIYTVGYILTPSHFLGIFLLYVLATWGTLVAFYRTAQLITTSPDAAIAATALAACCLFSRFTAFWAAQPEQLLALPFAWTLYYLTAFLKQPTADYHHPLSRCLSIGATCTFLIKYNFVLPYVAVFGLAVFAMARHLSISDILTFIIRCILYATLICVPFIIYFSYYGLWKDFFYAYFLLNIEATSQQQVVSAFSCFALKRKFLASYTWLSYVVLGHALVCALTKYRPKVNQTLMRQLLVVIIFTYLSCAMGLWGYYYIMMAPVALYLCADLAECKALSGFLQRKRLVKATVFTLTFILIVNAYCISPLAWGRPASETKQLMAIQDMIAKIPTPKIVYYDCPDILLGRKAQSIPGTPAWMGLSGVSEKTYNQRKRDIEERKIDFIITQATENIDTEPFLKKAGYAPIPNARLAKFSYMRNVQVWALRSNCAVFPQQEKDF